MSRAWFLSTRGVVVVAAAATLLALAESRVAPWAPYYGLYAAAVLVLPWWLRAPAFGRPRAVRARWWLAAVVAGLGMQAAAAAWEFGVYRPVLSACGVPAAALDGPAYSLGAALQLLFQQRGLAWGVDPSRLLQGYLAFVVLWAGLGEEVFYRGYVHGRLAPRHGFAVATAVSAGFFAIRHAVQLALLAPAYPWGAAVSWVVVAALFGVVLSALYVRSGSLGPSVLAHYLFNLVPFVAGLAAPS